MFLGHDGDASNINCILQSKRHQQNILLVDYDFFSQFTPNRNLLFNLFVIS